MDLRLGFKRFLGRPIFTLLLLSGSMGVATAQFLYTVNGDTVTITGYEGPGGVVSIPSSIEGKPVVAVGSAAFSKQATIETIILGANVETIGSLAFFGCANLATVEMNPALTQIGTGAFRDCVSLTQIDLPASLQTIGTDAFQGCTNLLQVTGGQGLQTIGERAFYLCSSLKSIALGGQLVTIDKTAFGYCTSLESVSLPASLQTIGQRAFQECHGLTSIDIPAGVTVVGSQQFSDCQGLLAIHVDPANPDYSSVDGILFDKQQTHLLAFAGGRSGSYQIPEGVEKIGDTAFHDSTKLSEVIFADSVAEIGFAAFAGCLGLTAVEIPVGVTFIDERAFTECESLLSIDVAPDNPVYAGLDGVLFTKDLTRLLQFPAGQEGLYVVPETTTTIGTFAFALSPSLTEVVIPPGVQTLETLAFYYCGALRGLYFAGQPPTLAGSSVFASSPGATAYHRSAATGWGAEFGGIPTAIWNPSILTSNGSFGIEGGRMQFTVLWSEDATVNIYARESLTTTPWSKIGEATIADYTGLFIDSTPASQAARFYQVEIP